MMSNLQDCSGVRKQRELVVREQRMQFRQGRRGVTMFLNFNKYQKHSSLQKKLLHKYLFQGKKADVTIRDLIMCTIG